MHHVFNFGHGTQQVSQGIACFRAFFWYERQENRIIFLSGCEWDFSFLVRATKSGRLIKGEFFGIICMWLPL